LDGEEGEKKKFRRIVKIEGPLAELEPPVSGTKKEGGRGKRDREKGGGGKSEGKKTATKTFHSKKTPKQYHNELRKQAVTTLRGGGGKQMRP